jgi:hypothetical protein
MQRKAWMEDKRFVGMPAGRRSGKTDISMHRVVRKALQPYPWFDPRFGLGAPTRAQAKRIFWRTIKSIVPERWVAGISESELRIDLLNGAEIWVVGMDAPARVEGIPWDGFVLDEFANMKREAWYENVRPSLAERRGWGWMIGVPQGRNHYWELCEEYKDRPECGFYTWTSATVLPADEIAQLYRDLDPRTARQELEASFEEAEGRIYYAFSREKDVHDFALPPEIGTARRPWYGGMDFNVSPMCGVWGWETEETDEMGQPETHVWVWDEIHEDTANTASAARVIKDKCRKARRFGDFYMHPDPTGKARHTSAELGVSDHSILRDLGFKVRTRSASPSRRGRYNAVNTMFCTGRGRRRTHIHPRNKHLIKGLEGLLYAENSNEPDKVRCVDLDHPTDAYGYWIEKRHRLRYKMEARNF